MASMISALPLLVLSLVGPVPPARAQELDVVEAAARIIEERVPAGVQEGGLDRAAIEGMTRWLDEATGVPGNALLTEEQHAELQQRLRGERFGLGIEFTVAPGRGLLVTGVRPGSPAAASSVHPGDIIVAIDDRAFIGQPGPAIVAMVAERTRRGGPVALDLKRGDEALHRQTLQPAAFTAPPARVTRDDDHLQVVIDVVGDGVAELVRGELETAPQAVVLDLRDVSEGRLDSALALAGLFVGPDRPLLWTVDPSGARQAHHSRGSAAFFGPLIVLVNRGTAGVAEALVAALDSGASTTVAGTRTAGVASVPSFHPLGDGLVLQLADTALLSADGGSWAGRGLAPDLLVEPVQVPLVGPVRATPPDIQLDAALRYVGAR